MNDALNRCIRSRLTIITKELACHWQGLHFPLEIQTVSKFKKKKKTTPECLNFHDAQYLAKTHRL